MDTAELLRFLRDANQHGYAAGGAAETRREPDGSTTIAYASEGWVAHDNFFGGEPYGGRLVVSQAGRPVWMLVYYGRVEAPAAMVQPVYSFLQRALRASPHEFPVRGPAEFRGDDFAYRSAYQGDVRGFRGEETIDHRGQPVYAAWFSGGLVDQRAGD